MSRNRKALRSRQDSPIRFSARPSVEALDRRDLLATISPVLQGTVFLDTVGNGIRTNSAAEVGLANATVKLEQGSTVLATTLTDANGNYVFAGSNIVGGLTVGGTYQLVETPPTGDTNTAAQALSQIDTATVTASNTIQVTIASPTAVTATFTGPTVAIPGFDVITYNFSGVAHTTAPTQLSFTLSGGGVAANTAITTYCVGLTDDLTQGLNFPTVLDSQGALPNGGEIAYLYNQYGVTLPSTSQLPTAIQSFPTKDIEAGLQVAIWDLEYNTNPSSPVFVPTGAYTGGSFGTTAQNYQNMLTAAAAFIADAGSKPAETLEVLDASLTGTLPSGTATAGGQSVLASESFNFGNAAKINPTINTSQQPATATVGTSIADKATVTGGNSPTGTVTFSLYSNSAGTGTPLYTDTETLSGGTATSKGYIATASATDYWVATYNGDSNNNTATSGTASEPVVITKTNPVINTAQQPATATVGTSIADMATVTGGYNPTGTVTFSLYNNSAGTGTPLYTDTESLVNGTATSKGYIATATATDYWVATYNGDANNNAITSPAANEPVSITKYAPTINTVQLPASALAGTSIADQATVTGYNPTGTVTFSLYNNSAGTGTALFTDTETLSGGIATSKGYVAIASGTDYWLATYNGDANNNAITSPAANEPVSIIALASISGTVYVDSNANDTLDAGDTGLGGITVTLYSGSGTSGTPVATTTSASNGTYSFTGLAPGVYSIQEGATPGYNRENANPGISGGTPWWGAITGFNLTAGTNDTGNNFGQYQLASVSGTVYVDNNVNDTLDAGDTGLGGITVTLYNAAGTAVATTTSASNGTYSFTGLAPGVYSIGEGATPGYNRENANPGTSGGTPWWGAITGFNLTSGANDTGNNFGQYKNTPAINTTQLPAYAVDGTSVADKATVTGGYNPTGTVTFELFANPTGTGTPVFTDTETLSGGTATSKGFVVNGVGTASWVAIYNGDTNNNSVTSPAANEPVVVVNATPTINTSQQPATATVGTSIADKATVSGGDSPTGTVTFSLYSNSAGTGTPLYTDTETLSGGTATSKGYIATASATDYWVATYNGDYDNASVTSGTASEPVVVTKANPVINTAQQPATATVGTSIADMATVTGGYNPTGTVTFSLYNNSAGTGTPLYTDTETLSGGTATSKGYIATATATDYWLATYNGDSNNSTATSGTASEPVSVTKTNPTLNTSQQPAIAAVGTSIADMATVTGGYNPTGTVTFSLYSNSAGTGTPLFTDTETLSGGTATSKGYIATATGTDYWLATYNGDSNNSSATSPAASEPVVVTPSTSISGTKYQDTTGNGLCPTTNAPLAGDIPEAGVTINLYNNVNGTPVYVESTVTAANGTYSFTNLPYGTYFVAETVPSGQIQTGPYATSTCTTATPGDCGFQNPSEGTGCYIYNPSGATWTFWGQSGISGNGSGFTSGNSCAPQGSDVAFLQCQGSISQNVSGWSAGNYQLSFSAAQRANYGLNNEDFEILVDGNIVATCKPTGSSYQTYCTPSFYVGSGSHTISFQGLDSCGGDNTAFLDNVCVVQNSGTVTESSGQAYYTVSLASCSPNSANNNFSDYIECNTSAITNVSYKVNGCGPYSSLSGVTSQSSTVSATFTVTGSSSQMVTLVSYAVPYSGAPLTSQVVYSEDTGTFTPGTHTVSVTLPCGYYQVDFVCGAAITQFGPSSSNDTYHGEQRFISSDSGGWQNPSYKQLPLANAQSDIGAVAAPGTLSYTNGSYTVTADGNDVWNNADAFNYVYQTLDGDGEIIAQVTGISSTDSWAKAGLMIRQSLAANSAQASVFASQGNGVVFQDRETAGASSNNWGASNSYGCNSTTAVYLKLVRMGSTITGYDSHDGVNWTQVGTDTVAMTGTVYIGLATSSHAVNVTATYANVNASGYYCGGAGQSLIQNNGGCSSSTSLSSWLASCYPNLYGSSAGCDNVWGMNNNQLASFCQSLETQCGSESLECQTLSTALDEYFSNWSWGGYYGSQAGFSTSWNGYGSTCVSTGSSSSAFGGSCSISVYTMLGDINNQSWSSCLYNGNTVYHQQAYSCVTWASACV